MTAKRWLGFSLVLIAVMWSGIARAAVVIDADPIAVGNVVVLTTSSPATAQLSSTVNNVTVDIVLSSTCTGPGTGTFTLSTPMGLTGVNLNNPVTLSVTYRPTTRGFNQCQVDVFEGATLQLSFNVTATGVAPVVSAPASVTFAPTRWNDLAVTTTNSQPLTVTNASTDTGQTLQVTSLSIAGGDASDFTISGPASASIAPQANAQWTITMNPSAAGVRTTTLTLTTNDPITPMKMITLSGTGTNALISATDVTLPSAVIGGGATLGSVVVANSATSNVGTLTGTAATISGSTWFSFGTGSGCTAGTTACALTSFTMPPNKTIPVRCQVPAGQTGTQTATVTITSDTDPGGDSTAVLTCTALQHATPSAAVLAFGDVEVGKTTNAQTLTVTNTGGQNLTISNAGLLANATEYGVSGIVGVQNTVVPPSGTASWDITCHPTTQGSKNTSFRITSNTDGVIGTNVDIALTCNGQQGVLVIAPTSHNFGGVREFFSASMAFTLTNTGNVPVTGIMPTLDAKLLGFSILSPAFPINLGPGANAIVTVQFAPQSGSDGCLFVSGTDCSIRFAGSWGTTPTTAAATTIVQGDGLVTGYDTSPAAPNALDFGDVRFDLTRPMQIQVINTAGTPMQLRGASIAGGTAIAGEFLITSCTLNGVGVTCPTMATPINNFTGTLIVNVLCDPMNRVAMFDSTFTVTSDLMVNPSRTVPLRCNSITAGLGVNPGMMIDFGATDMDNVPVAVTLPLTITNTGTAAMVLGAGTKLGSTTFTTTALAGQTIQPNASYNVTITYTPTIEKPSNQPDTGSISFPITGVFGNPNLTIQLSGYGVDRHINVAPVPVFPDTFKNPGDQAPVMPVTITNNGDARLDVTAVMLTNDPVWTLENPGPTMIAGRQSHNFNVRFSPTMAGKAPIGKLTIVNNDNGMPMVSVDLNGNGLDRNVAMSPGEINLGYTGIGIPIRLSELTIMNQPAELLNVASGDGMHMFTIASIAIEGGDGAFVIEDQNGNAPASIGLGPLASQTFDIVFTPNAEADFEASAYLLLDQDPQPQAVVKLRGRGLFVDGGGGGGCSSTGGSGIAMIAVVLALLLRRRRIGLLLLSSVGVAGAETRNLSLTVFDPTPATTGTGFHVQDATVGDSGDYALTALISYANAPFVLRTVQNDDAAVKNRTTLELGFAYALGRKFEAGARMPLYVQSGDAVSDPTMAFNVTPGSGAAFGDLTLHGKMNLGVAPALAGRLAYGLGAALTVPTATRDEFAGNELPTGRALFLLSHVTGPLATTINAGGIVRAKAEYANIHQGSGMTWGAGVSYRVLDALWVNGEMFGDLIPGGRSGQPPPGEAMGEAQLAASIEWLVGVHFRMTRTASLGLAGGRGLTRGVGAPAGRVALTFAYTPGADELKPVRVPRPPVPPKDSDDDGIVDEADACPNEPEDKDQFDDTDGCPDPDNDQDGIADAADKCPLDAEDRDQFEDENGCPDKDNDFDGLNDAKDKCPFAAEDNDGFQDTDGCPDPDNDGDGLLDNVDKCPREAETINGNADDDGCPDKGDSLVVLSTDRLELLESIQFVNRDQIARSSRNVLGQLGATLRAHPELKRVRITVHVNPTSNSESDQRLSEARAKAVKEWLVDYGIDSLRVQTAGFGSTKPLVPASQRGAQQINDRVELIILEKR